MLKKYRITKSRTVFTILNKLILGFLILFFSCGERNETKNLFNITSDSLKTKIDKEEKDLSDSLRLSKILKNALNIANQNINKIPFTKKYAVLTDSIPVSVEINLDYTFSKANPHLIIRRNDPGAIYIDIYSQYDERFEKVLSHEQWNMTYVNDTISDINGDGLDDFVINWYGATGCCLKAFSNIYLLRKDNKTFSKDFQFINPTFSPKEKTIRGVCYGQPGETEMYKYKWNGEEIDTLEYVSFEQNEKGEKTGKILISNSEPANDKIKIIKRLNSVPHEYKSINGYDWFTGNL